MRTPTTLPFIGADFSPMIVPDPSQADFRIPDLRLPKTVTADTIEHRQSFLKVVDRLYREKEQQGRVRHDGCSVTTGVGDAPARRKSREPSTFPRSPT